MSNKLSVFFDTCTPAPSNGYDLYYRIKATTGPYLYGGNFTASPAVVEIASDPDGSLYEGYIQSNCGGGNLGNQIPFVNLTAGSESAQFGRASSLEAACDIAGYVTLYYAPPVHSGSIMYTDFTLQTPFVGYPVIVDLNDGSKIYSVNQTTGEITYYGVC